MKGPTDKPAVKRRRVDLKTKIVTDAEYLAELQEKRKQKQERQQKENPQKR